MDVSCNEALSSSLVSRTFPCQSHLADFIIKHLSVEFPHVRLDKVKKGVEISGLCIKRKEVNRVFQVLETKSFKRDYVTFSAPFLKDYFRKHKWISFVDDIQKEFRCCVSLMENYSERFCNFLVAVKQGDITKENTDVIINRTIIPDFHFARGAFLSAHFGYGGMEMQNCIYNPSTSVLPSFAQVTTGFNLPWQRVIHIITPSSVDYNELIVKIKWALDFAEQHNFKSLSLSSLGAGNGISPLLVDAAMYEAFKKFDAESPRNVKAINVIVYERNVLPLFQKLLFVSESYECDDSTTPTLERMTVLTISDSCEGAQAAEKIKEYKSSVFGKEKILASGKINLLEDCDKQDIRELSTLCGICVQFKHNGPSKIELCGFKESVWKVKKQIEVILEECVLAQITANDYVWKRETEKGKLSYLPLRVSHQIERKYQKNKDEELFMHFRGVKVIFNLSSMSYSIPKQEKTGKLFREYTKIEGLPNNYWEFMRGKDFAKYVVDPLSEEYRLVKSKLGTGFPGTLIQIERIQNISLYRQYCIKKNSVERNMTSNRPVERELFHGTSVDNANRICFDGFDRSFAGKNGTTLGKGTYFAVNSNVSTTYSCPDPAGRNYMFLTRVLTGEYSQGQRDYMVPPKLPQQSKDGIIRTYDSVVDCESDPREFAVFKDSSAYPEYLITFSSPNVNLHIAQNLLNPTFLSQPSFPNSFLRNFLF